MSAYLRLYIERSYWPPCLSALQGRRGCVQRPAGGLQWEHSPGVSLQCQPSGPHPLSLGLFHRRILHPELPRYQLMPPYWSTCLIPAHMRAHMHTVYAHTHKHMCRETINVFWIIPDHCIVDMEFPKQLNATNSEIWKLMSEIGPLPRYPPSPKSTRFPPLLTHNSWLTSFKIALKSTHYQTLPLPPLNGEDILNRCSSPFFVPFPAYRLKKCPVPPGVENAEMIYEDENFQIGKRQHHFTLFVRWVLHHYLDWN